MVQSLGQLMIDLVGTRVSHAEAKMLSQPHVGGVILFTRNFQSPEQLKSLVQEIRAIRDPIIIAVDQEGGRVQRFKDGFTALAPLADLGKVYSVDSDRAIALAREHASTMAQELKEVDIDLSFTPLLDRDLSLNTVIGNRSFSDHHEVIIELASHYIEAMHQQGMPATGKHFPGHGSVDLDSHFALPVDPRPMNDIAAQDRVPFDVLAPQLDAMMPAHILFPEVDDLPVGFSSKWLKQILRAELGFDGVIFSDDLTMKATEEYGDYAQRAALALNAGCDMILVCNCPEGAEAVLDQWPHQDAQEAHRSKGRLSRLLSLAVDAPVVVK